MPKKKDNEVIKLDDSKATQETFEEGYEKTEAKPEDNKDIRAFDYGDLQFQCYRCGHKETVDTGVKDGIQIVLATNDTNRWSIVCNRCKNRMDFYFTENHTKAKEVAEEEAKKKALEKAKEKKETKGKKKKNERTKKDSKKEESV